MASAVKLSRELKFLDKLRLESEALDFWISIGGKFKYYLMKHKMKAGDAVNKTLRSGKTLNLTNPEAKKTKIIAKSRNQT